MCWKVVGCSSGRGLDAVEVCSGGVLGAQAEREGELEVVGLLRLLRLALAVTAQLAAMKASASMAAKHQKGCICTSFIAVCYRNISSHIFIKRLKGKQEKGKSTLHQEQWTSTSLLPEASVNVEAAEKRVPSIAAAGQNRTVMEASEEEAVRPCSSRPWRRQRTEGRRSRRVGEAGDGASSLLAYAAAAGRDRRAMEQVREAAPVRLHSSRPRRYRAATAAARAQGGEDGSERRPFCAELLRALG